MSIQKMTDEELYRIGIEILAKRLGSKGVNRFLNMCEPLPYDYSVKRHEWIDAYANIDAIMKDMQQVHETEDIKDGNKTQTETIFIKEPEAICTNNMTDRELHKVALKILVEKLSIAGMPRFVRLCSQKAGNHAIERK